MHKISLAVTHPGLPGRRAEQLPEESLGFVAMGRELEGQPPGILVESLSHTTDVIFLWWIASFHKASAWGMQYPTLWTPRIESIFFKNLYIFIINDQSGYFKCLQYKLLEIFPLHKICHKLAHNRS